MRMAPILTQLALDLISGNNRLLKYMSLPTISRVVNIVAIPIYIIEALNWLYRYTSNKARKILETTLRIDEMSNLLVITYTAEKIEPIRLMHKFRNTIRKSIFTSYTNLIGMSIQSSRLYISIRAGAKIINTKAISPYNTDEKYRIAPLKFF